jgi:hypothetical protein
MREPGGAIGSLYGPRVLVSHPREVRRELFFSYGVRRLAAALFQVG